MPQWAQPILHLLEIPQAKQFAQSPDLEAGIPVSMGDGTAFARSVAAVASVNINDFATNARSVAAVPSVSMDDNATTAKSVVARESVTMGNGTARTARSVDAARSGSEQRWTMMMILQDQKSTSHHRRESYLTWWK